MKIEMPWPESLKRLCTNDCAERGETPCWKVDESMEPFDFGWSERGRPCDDCYAAWSGPHSRAALDVLIERRRQQDVEGWTEEHDDRHIRGELGAAAACYAAPLRHQPLMLEQVWPPTWDNGWWKPKDRRRDLVRAAALIIAEIERLDR